MERRNYQNKAERLISKLLVEFALPLKFKQMKKQQGSLRHTVNDNFYYSGPTSFIILGENRTVISATELIVGVCEILYERDDVRM